MKHIKTYKIYESKILNPVEKYLLPLYDLGFEEVKGMGVRVQESNSLGLVEISMKIENPKDEFLLEVFGEYLALIDRLKSDFTITGYNIIFGQSSIKITFKRKVTDILQEIEMDTNQKIAYDSILKCLNEGERLSVEHIWENSISFNVHNGSYGTGFVSIHSSGRISLPILRGYKSQHRTDLPFTDEDINWFKRIIWIDEGNRWMKNREEYDTLHEKSQQELREIYK
jgi:hypothetical protein